MRPDYAVLGIFLLAIVIPMVVVAIPLFFNLRVGKWKNTRKPQDSKLLRPPGHSLGLKIEQLEESYNFYITISLGLPGALLAMMLASSGYAGTKPITFWFYQIAIFGLAIGLGWKLYQILKKLRAFRLGLSGEQAVGEALNSLLANGCSVFHDFTLPNQKRDWNIDHIVIAPGKVYAIETKARRKAPGKFQKNDYTLSYDGTALLFPWGRNLECVDQVRLNANSLSEWLSQAVGEPILVQPVLVFPGWFIDFKGKGDVLVMNSKHLENNLHPNHSASEAEAKLMKQISHQINHRCRDIEF